MPSQYSKKNSLPSKVCSACPASMGCVAGYLTHIVCCENCGKYFARQMSGVLAATFAHCTELGARIDVDYIREIVKCGGHEIVEYEVSLGIARACPSSLQVHYSIGFIPIYPLLDDNCIACTCLGMRALEGEEGHAGAESALLSNKLVPALAYKLPETGRDDG